MVWKSAALIAFGVATLFAQPPLAEAELTLAAGHLRKQGLPSQEQVVSPGHSAGFPDTLSRSQGPQAPGQERFEKDGYGGLSYRNQEDCYPANAPAMKRGDDSYPF